MSDTPVIEPWRAREARAESLWARGRACLRVWAQNAVGARGKAAAKLVLDLALMSGAALWAWFVAFGQAPARVSPLPFLAVILCGRLPVYLAFRLHRMSWRIVSKYDLAGLAASAVLAVPLIALLFYVLPDPFTLRHLLQPHLLLATEPVLYLVLLSGARMAVRSLANNRRRRQRTCRVLIVGTGDAARSLVWQILESATEYDVIGFVDDDPGRQGRRILGRPVFGAIEDLVSLVPRLEVQQIVIAIPSLSPERLREVIAICQKTGAPVRILPPLRELMGAGVHLAALREVRMEDLLPRPEVTVDEAAISSYLQGRTVLVTGGGGSIGGELCRQLLRFAAARLLVLGRGENSVFQICHELAELKPPCEVVPVICDVQDRRALAHVFARFRPDVVFHAAAHKHVSLMEQYPAEAVKNNVLGTLNIVTLSVEHPVDRFVLVSTDKAVDPTSVMGSTKHVAEHIVKAFALARDANMVSVRFGNVLGSRGSVVPLMAHQIQNGLPVTVTDPAMARYFMTIPEAVQLILQAGAIGGKGEVFVLDMGSPVRIIDLAQELIRRCGLIPDQDVPIRIIGRRPGEKLMEHILSRKEEEGAQKNGQFYIAPSQQVDLDGLLHQIEALRRAADTDDRHEILRLLGRAVPSYRPDRASLRATHLTSLPPDTSWGEVHEHI